MPEESRPAPVMVISPSKNQPESASLVGAPKSCPALLTLFLGGDRSLESARPTF
ncbi:MAG: hypothetical protein AB4042_09275 [Leptolyngbyaceae cyanobacterium]